LKIYLGLDLQVVSEQAKPDNEDCNMKFLRALPPSWSQVAITFKVAIDGIGNDMTYAEQLIQFIKNQVAASIPSA
ncbi:hypothetical protein Tco_0332717, partial [Tanacetum coccineum]